MKKSNVLPLIIVVFLLGLSTIVFFKANAATMKTTVQASPLDNVQVNNMSDINITVDHVVTILQGGSIAINDTMQLSAKQDTTLTNFSLGFPYGYKFYLGQVHAFNTSYPAQIFNVSMDTGLGSSIGYYGVMVIFPQGGVQLRVGGTSFRFTVVFVFSNLILSSTTTGPTQQTTSSGKIVYVNETTPVLTMEYPMFPSLLQNASVANVTIITPPNTIWQGNSGNQSGKKSTVDTSQIVSTIIRPLPALTYAPGWFNFSENTGSTYQLVTINNLERHAEIDGQGNIFITDTYTVTSHESDAVSSMYLDLPTGASNITAYDAQGDSLSIILVNKTTTTYSLSFAASLETENSTQFTLNYFLRSSNYTNRTGSSGFNLNVPVTEGLDSVVGRLTFKISLPQGASITEYPNFNYDLQNEALEQGITLTVYNASSYNNIDLHLSYVYSVFWASFGPTLWMTTIVAVGLAIALFWRAQKLTAPIPGPSVIVKPQTLKALVSSYEERTKTMLELESLERQAQKGRLPRRRYKVRKRILESQMSRLDRELVDLKQRAKSMGPRYAEILKDLDVAEAELEGIEAEERRAATRYRAGAYTLDAYHRMQEQYNKRREKAKTTIEGAILRLSEGMA
jgi:hypothetical protein